MPYVPKPWQMLCSETSERGAHVLRTGVWADCELLIGPGKYDAVVRCHKLILAMASPFFETMFYEEEVKPGKILIENIDLDVCMSMLRYMYFSDTNIISFDVACGLYRAANTYSLPYLMEECVKYTKRKLSVENACQAYAFGKEINDDKLILRARRIICIQTKEVFSNENFTNIKLKTLGDIFDEEFLSIDSELELFDAAVVYENANKNKEEDSPVSPTELSLEDVVKKIKYLTLTAEEFINGPGNSKLIQAADALVIYKKLLSNRDDIAMPDGFSESTIKRRTNYIVLLEFIREKRRIERNGSGESYWNFGKDSWMSLTFSVEKPFNLLGIWIPTQKKSNERYEENLTVDVICRSTKTYIAYHHTHNKILKCNGFQELCLESPCLIKPNLVYEISVWFHKGGVYPVLTENLVNSIITNDLVIYFEVDRKYDHKAGLIRSLIYKLIDQDFVDK